jgi:hypothetical protein
MLRTIGMALALLALAATPPTTAQAQPYAAKTITMIVNNPAGGPTDLEARIVAKRAAFADMWHDKNFLTAYVNLIKTQPIMIGAESTGARRSRQGSERRQDLHGEIHCQYDSEVGAASAVPLCAAGIRALPRARRY